MRFPTARRDRFERRTRRLSSRGLVGLSGALLVACCAAALGSSQARGEMAPEPSSRTSTKDDPHAPGPDAQHLPPQTCASPSCHGSLVEELEKTRHGHYTSDPKLGPAAGCGVCHGPASDHVRDPAHGKIFRFTEGTPVNARRVNEACISCHQETIRKPHYNSSEHARAGLSCASCHEVHYDLKTPYLLRLPGSGGPAGQPTRPPRKKRKDAPSAAAPAPGAAPAVNLPKLERAARTRVAIPGWRTSFQRQPDAVTEEQAINELCVSCHRQQVTEFRQLSHHPVIEERMTCTSCHDAHHEGVTRNGRMLKGHMLADTCFECHKEKRGPFIFEHQPVKAGGIGEGCLECHRPHGSPNRNLQVFFSRAVCLQCHVDIQRDPEHQGRPGDCWRAGCHVALHGSNRDRFFTRE